MAASRCERACAIVAWKLGLQLVMLSIGLLISLTYALVRPERF